MGEPITNAAVLLEHDRSAAFIAHLGESTASGLRVCQTPADIRNLAGSNPPDLVLIITPVADELLEALLAVRGRLGCPIIAISSETVPDITHLNQFADRLILLEPGTEHEPDTLIPLLERWEETETHTFQLELKMLQECYQMNQGNPRENMDAITRTLGKLLNADCVLYNRLDEGLLCTWSSWQLPEDAVLKDPPEGHICFDVITNSNRCLMEVHNLQTGPYAQKDSYVGRFGLETYIGRAVWCGKEAVGSLCCVYRKPVHFSETERTLLETAAIMIGFEEERLAIISRDSEREQHYQNLLDSLPIGIYRTDPDGTLLEANRELIRMLGYPDRETLLSRNVLDLFQNPRDRDAWTTGIMDKRHRFGATFVLKKYDGSFIWVEDIGRIILGEAGEVTCFEGALTDITRRVELEETFRQAQKMDALGRLAGGFAHEFNNLLTVINGYAELLQSNTSPDHPSHDRIGAILTAGRRAADLVSELLAFSRKQLIQPVPLDVSEHLEGMMDVIRRLAGPTISVTVQCDPGLPKIKADSDQMEQLVLNLVLNAVAAIRDSSATEPGTIHISADPVNLEDPMASENAQIDPGTYLRLSIRDDGIGIPEDIMPLIFEPFFTTREVGKGSGLGLAAVHGIVIQNSGLVTVESQVGEGTVFHVFWPALASSE